MLNSCNKSLLALSLLLGSSLLSCASSRTSVPDDITLLGRIIPDIVATHAALSELAGSHIGDSRKNALHGLNDAASKLASWQEAMTEELFAFYKTEELVEILQAYQKTIRALQGPLQTSTSLFSGNSNEKRNEELRTGIAALQHYTEELFNLNKKAARRKILFPSRASEILDEFKTIAKERIDSHDEPIDPSLVEKLQRFSNDPYLPSELKLEILTALDQFNRDYIFVATRRDRHFGESFTINGYIPKQVIRNDTNFSCLYYGEDGEEIILSKI